MLVNDSSAISRLNSKDNLINKLSSLTSGNKRQSAMGLFGIGRNQEDKKEKVLSEEVIHKEEGLDKPFFNPFDKPQEAVQQASVSLAKTSSEDKEPSLSHLIENSDQQIKLATAHDNALEVLTSAIESMKLRLDEVKADKLPAVITATSKVVESIRKERSEAARSGKDKEVHYHFYTPVQKRIESYDVIEVS